VRGVPLDAVDAALEPTPLSARTTTLYETPLVNPEIVKGSARVPALVHVVPPSSE
jgi:hypothetical protein